MFTVKVQHGRYIPHSMDGKDRCGETLAVEGVAPTMTVSEFKARVMALNTKDEDNHWFNERSTLMYAGKIMDRPRSMLEDYDIRSECDVVFAYWFTDLNVNLPKYKIKLFKKAFDKYDDDGGGQIDAEEFYLLVNEMGMRRARKTCEQMVAAADEDGDMMLDFEEFCNMMVKIMREDLDGGVFAALEEAAELTENELRERDGGALIMWEPGRPGIRAELNVPAWKKRDVVFNKASNSYVFADEN